MHKFFELNREIVLFVYGQTFFVMGLAIFLQSRRYSRLKLAYDLRWLEAFGILYGFHVWGQVFIPIQAEYLPAPYLDLLQALQAILLALSFLCLFVFGLATLERWRSLRLVAILGVIWAGIFLLTLYLYPTAEEWYRLSSIWARYLLGLPASVVAALGLRHQYQRRIAPLIQSPTLVVASYMLFAYAFLGGIVVRGASFFPANFINQTVLEDQVGIPVEVFRSLIGLVLAVSIIRTLEIFELEVDRLIEQMEIERIQSAERDRIGQEIHDGAMQGVYSVGLILESLQPHFAGDQIAVQRLTQVQNVLDNVITDLRRYMLSLRTHLPNVTLHEGLQKLVKDPRFSNLLTISLEIETEPDLYSNQIPHILAVIQEALANTLRHANARHASIRVYSSDGKVVFEVKDDGQGFNPAAITPGFGLRAMRDHTQLLQADLVIENRGGTLIKLIVPEKKK
jgi:signal transduction histidine kinase